MPKKNVGQSAPVVAGLVIRTEKVAPEFVSRRHNSERYDKIIDAIKAAGVGQWVVIGPFGTSLEGLRLIAMRGYKKVVQFCEAEHVSLEMHMHKVDAGIEFWVRSVLVEVVEGADGG